MEMALNTLEKGLIELGLSPTPLQLKQFQTFYEILIEWNSKMNLTSITVYEEVVIKHFLDSVNIVRAFDISQINSIMDVGTGAGFPGIPLKIMFPDLSITLLDALNKRVQFMNKVIEILSLNGIIALHERAENLATQETYRGFYDLVVSRAVSNLATLSEYCLPFTKEGGFFIAYKSEETDDELKNSENAITILGGKINQVVDSVIVGTNMPRRYVVIDKIQETPMKYPRKAGLPGKKPL